MIPGVSGLTSCIVMCPSKHDPPTTAGLDRAWIHHPDDSFRTRVPPLSMACGGTPRSQQHGAGARPVGRQRGAASDPDAPRPRPLFHAPYVDLTSVVASLVTMR
ncbi:hypothetical protein GCM10023339_22490 [Alloalcanivorax gelatiniphagus]